jgi:hypothetical protein
MDNAPDAPASKQLTYPGCWSTFGGPGMEVAARKHHGTVLGSMLGIPVWGSSSVD